MSVDSSSRRRLIMDYICEHGLVQDDQLSNYTQAISQTFRRDHNQLYERKLLRRVPGGGVCREHNVRLEIGDRIRTELSAARQG